MDGLSNLEDSSLEVDTNVLAKIIAPAERFVASLERAGMRCGKEQSQSGITGKVKIEMETCVCHKYECCECVVSNAPLERSTFRTQKRRKRRFGSQLDRYSPPEWGLLPFFDETD